MTYHLRMFLNWANDVRISNQEVSTRGQTPEGQYVVSKQSETATNKIGKKSTNQIKIK